MPVFQGKEMFLGDKRVKYAFLGNVLVYVGPPDTGNMIVISHSDTVVTFDNTALGYPVN